MNHPEDVLKLSVFCLAAALLMYSLPAWANLRAPKATPGQVSSALYPAQEVEVGRETLTIACERIHCAVEAVYHLKAERASSVDLEFILPRGVEVEASLGQKPLAVEATEVTELTPEEAEYGYFVDSRFVHSVQYEVWPIKQWRRSEDFTLDLTVKMKRDEPGWWASTFGTLRGLRCALGRRGQVLTSVQEDGQLVVRRELRELPDRLFCYMGDEDLLPKPVQGAP
jgi:hypothetical protein